MTLINAAKITLISIGCRIIRRFDEELNEYLKEKWVTRFYL
jgi:hypothetical protein